MSPHLSLQSQVGFLWVAAERSGELQAGAVLGVRELEQMSCTEWGY